MRVSCVRIALMAALVQGGTLWPHAVARAEEAPPVAVDLVDLAVALADAAGAVQELGPQLEFAEQQRRKGFIPTSEFQALSARLSVARQKLKLLKLIVQAEFDAATRRATHLKQLHEAGTLGGPHLLEAVELRRALLEQMLKLTDVQGRATDEQTPSQSDLLRSTFSGVVRVKGELPPLPPLVRTGDVLVSNRAGDVLVRAGADIPDADSLVVGVDQGLANVFVFMKKAPPASQAGVPVKAAAMTSRNNRFEPHCTIVRAGQGVRFTNQESVATNFHLFPVRNEARNQVIAPNSDVGVEFQLTRPEPLPFKVTDDIHPWKSAYVLVVDHPFAALTDENGRFEIEGLPAGEHVFRFWHERGGFLIPDHVVTIGDDKVSEAAITVEAERLSSTSP